MSQVIGSIKEHQLSNSISQKRQTWALFLSELSSDRPLYAIIGMYVVCAIAYHEVLHVQFGESFAVYGTVWVTNFLILFPAALLLIGYIRITLRLNDRRRLAYRAMFAPRRLARFFAGTCLMFALWPFQTAFTSVKNAISNDGFIYDRIQADLDKVIHFGVDPWQHLYALSSHRLLLSVLEFNYSVVWFIFGFGMLYLIVVLPALERLRIRYLICFMMTWVVLGNVLAGIFISAGPAFYGHVTGDVERFALQLDLLARNVGFDHSAAYYQRYLWDLFQADKAGFASGISAFPSVHVGLTMMNALFIYEYNKKWGFFAFGYTLIILISSIYLGWHYAIDGYVSVAIVLALYVMARRVDGGLMRRSVVKTSKI